MARDICLARVGAGVAVGGAVGGAVGNLIPILPQNLIFIETLFVLYSFILQYCSGCCCFLVRLHVCFSIFYLGFARGLSSASCFVVARAKSLTVYSPASILYEQYPLHYFYDFDRMTPISCGASIVITYSWYWCEMEITHLSWMAFWVRDWLNSLNGFQPTPVNRWPLGS